MTATQKARQNKQILLQLVADAYVLHAGDPEKTAAAVGIDGKKARVLARQAMKLGLIQTRMRRVQGRWEIAIDEAIRDLLAMRDSKKAAIIKVWRDKAGKVKGKEEIYQPLRANELLAKMAGALEDQAQGDGSVRLAALLANAIAQHDEIRRREIAEGKIPLGLRMVRARAEAMAGPIETLRDAIDVTATVVAAPVNGGPSGGSPSRSTPGGSTPSSAGSPPSPPASR